MASREPEPWMESRMIENIEGLSPETARLWERLAREPLLSGFILVGGSAISLHIQHRLSEDLDFVTLDLSLPGKRLDVLVRTLSEDGFDIQHIRNVAGEREFEDSIFSFSDFQRDYRINDVKVTMFSPEQELSSVLKSSGIKLSSRGPVVADLPTLFESKAIICAKRNKTRDWFDLFILMRDHGFKSSDMKAAFDKHHPYGWDSAVQRLTKGDVSPHDEGYAHLVLNPPTLEEMREFFSREIEALEIRLMASDILKRDHDIEEDETHGPG